MNDFPKLVLATTFKGGTEQQQSDQNKNEGPYVCPCYANARRNSKTFLMTVNLKTDDPAHKWILRGVALLCTRDM